jgi:RNA polymerase subunit RPABC4/transcription elongation factor Spt4
MGFLSWMFGRNSTCPQCGAKVKAEFNFCPECKANSVGAWLLCSKCQNPIKGDMKFCPYCRTAQDPARLTRETAAVVWRRKQGQYAVRYEIDPEFVKQMTGEASARAGVIVEFGTKALLFVDGRLAQTLDAGRYVEFIGLGKNLPKGTTVQNHVVVALVSAGDTELSQTAVNIYTKDNIKLQARIDYVVRLKDPAAFYENVMKGKEETTDEDLRRLLGPELTNAASEVSRAKSSEDFIGMTAAVKQEAEVSAINHMNKTFARSGLEFVQWRFMEVGNEQMKAVMDERENREITQKRLELLNRAQQQEVQMVINKATNEAEAQKALMKIGLDRVVSKQEFAELAQAWADGRGDVEMARNQFKEKIKILYEVELKKTRLIEEGKLSLEQIALTSQQLKGTLENERLARVERARIDADVQREELKLTKERADVALDLRKRKQEIDMAGKQKEMEIEKIKIDSLKGMTSDQIKYYLAGQNPDLVRALVAEAEQKAQAERNKDLKVVYENIMGFMKDVSVAGATGKVSMANDAAKLVQVGAMAGKQPERSCVKCGAKLQPNYVACPNCGTEQPTQ